MRKIAIVIAFFSLWCCPVKTQDLSGLYDIYSDNILDGVANGPRQEPVSIYKIDDTHYEGRIAGRSISIELNLMYRGSQCDTLFFYSDKKANGERAVGEGRYSKKVFTGVSVDGTNFFDFMWIKVQHTSPSRYCKEFVPPFDAAVSFGLKKNYLFKGGDYFLYNMESDKPDAGFPRAINELLPGVTRLFPPINGTTVIDGAVNWGNGKAYLFQGNKYIRFDIASKLVDPGYPILMNGSNWPGVGDVFPMVNDAINWGNGKAYLFYNKQYIRFDIAADHADEGYPKNIDNELWPGLGASSINAAFDSENGKVYFFRGNNFIRYDIGSDRADVGYPVPIEPGIWPNLSPRDEDVSNYPVKITEYSEFDQPGKLFGWGGYCNFPGGTIVEGTFVINLSDGMQWNIRFKGIDKGYTISPQNGDMNLLCISGDPGQYNEAGRPVCQKTNGHQGTQFWSLERIVENYKVKYMIQNTYSKLYIGYDNTNNKYIQVFKNAATKFSFERAVPTMPETDDKCFFVGAKLKFGTCIMFNEEGAVILSNPPSPLSAAQPGLDCSHEISDKVWQPISEDHWPEFNSFIIAAEPNNKAPIALCEQGMGVIKYGKPGDEKIYNTSSEATKTYLRKYKFFETWEEYKNSNSPY